MEYSIQHKENNGNGTFYMEDEKGMVSELTYKLKKNGIMSVDHTKTRENLQGNGLASKVLAHVVGYARENSLKIEPVCPFVLEKFNETTSYQDVRA